MEKNFLFGLIVIIVVTGCQAVDQEQSQPVDIIFEDTKLVSSPTATQAPSESAAFTPTLTPTIAIMPSITLNPSITSTPDMYWFDDENEYWPQEPLGREYYAYAWKGEERIPAHNQLILEAYSNGEAWAADPIEIALRFSGYPNIDDLLPEAVHVFYAYSKVIVVVRTGRLMDDSIYEAEKRIDLVENGEAWQIEWAGFRQRCGRLGEITDWILLPCP